jgi:two-component system LytT family response regulator
MPISRRLRVLVIDDEPAARQRLLDLLANEADVEVIGTAGSGKEAVEAIKRYAPDLAFLDVQMPGLTGVQVVQEVGPENMPAVVFVTAYDQYAVKAFDLAALDYLLKPFDDERFEQALTRARQSITLREVSDLRGRLAALLQNTPAVTTPPPSASPYLERIGVELRGQLRIVPVDRIEFITASGDYAEVHVGDDTFLIREQMQTLEERLPPDRFFRIHRSTIVRIDLIDAILYKAGGDYAVRLRDGKRLKMSRGRREELEKRLGIIERE